MITLYCKDTLQIITKEGRLVFEMYLDNGKNIRVKQPEFARLRVQFAIPYFSKMRHNLRFHQNRLDLFLFSFLSAVIVFN